VAKFNQDQIRTFQLLTKAHTALSEGNLGRISIAVIIKEPDGNISLQGTYAGRAHWLSGEEKTLALGGLAKELKKMAAIAEAEIS